MATEIWFLWKSVKTIENTHDQIVMVKQVAKYGSWQSSAKQAV